MVGMAQNDDYLAMDDDTLLKQCDVHIYKSSGPGGQHRNKVSSAVRLLHRLTGINAHGDDSRSQHENKRLAIKRLRMNLACQVRRPVGLPPAPVALPAFVRECIFEVRGGAARGKLRMTIGPKDQRFWRVTAYLLDLLDAFEGQASAAADVLGISTSNFIGILQSDRHLLAAAQETRKRHGKKPLM